MLKSFASKFAYCGTVIALAGGAFVVVHDHVWCSDEPVATVSRSVAAAKARGVWVASLQPSPSELSLPDRTVHINSVWVEHCSRQSDRFLGPAEQRLGGFYLCFTVAE